MLNGDVILNFDFTEMIKFHEKNKGLGLIASKTVDDPSRYGVLIVDKSTSKISKFLEKPLIMINFIFPPSYSFAMIIEVNVFPMLAM